MDGPTTLMVASFTESIRKTVEKEMNSNPNVLDPENFLRMVLKNSETFIKENYRGRTFRRAT